jgi:hypothetical protein
MIAAPKAANPERTPAHSTNDISHSLSNIEY